MMWRNWWKRRWHGLCLMGKSKVRSDVSQVTLWFWLLHFLITNVIKKKWIVKEKSTDSKKDYPEERTVEIGWNLKGAVCAYLKMHQGMNIYEKEIMRCRKGMPEYKECTWKEIGYYGHPYSIKLDRNWKSSANKRKWDGR